MRFVNGQTERAGQVKPGRPVKPVDVCTLGQPMPGRTGQPATMPGRKRTNGPGRVARANPARRGLQEQTGRTGRAGQVGPVVNRCRTGRADAGQTERAGLTCQRCRAG